MATKKAPAKPTGKSAKTVIPARSKVTKSAKKKPSPKKEPKTPGRKPWLPDYAKIENWANNGLSDKAIAALCGISHPVFCTKKNELPKLRESLEYGRARGEAAVSQKLLLMALQGDREMIKFYLARRCGWTETVINKNLDLTAIDNMTIEELEELEHKLGI